MTGNKTDTLGVVAIFAISSLILGMVIVNHDKKERVLDCSMASFHPDFTKEMRQACRNNIQKT